MEPKESCGRGQKEMGRRTHGAGPVQRASQAAAHGDHGHQRAAVFPKAAGGVKAGGLNKAEAALVLSNRRDLEPMAGKAGLTFRLDVYWGVVKEV